MEALASLLPFVVVIGLMWLLLIRPQQVRQRQARELLNQVEPGDKVVTHGGLFAQVLSVEGDKVVLETSPGVSSTWLKGSISRIVQDDDESENDTDDDGTPAQDETGTPI